MSITGINSNSLASLYEYYTQESEGTTSSEDTLSSLLESAGESNGSADSIIFSSESQIYCRLQQLQESDNDEFKKVCSEIAEKLSDSALKAGGTSSAELAVKFASAADSGTMDDLQVSSTTSTTSDSTSSTSSYLSKYYAQLLSQSSDDSSSTSSLLTQILSEMGISI
ncbi:hypothetical protein LLG46_06175 [bacterium]|nr:hypothetical protein [bacterium]